MTTNGVIREIVRTFGGEPEANFRAILYPPPWYEAAATVTRVATEDTRPTKAAMFRLGGITTMNAATLTFAIFTAREAARHGQGGAAAQLRGVEILVAPGGALG